MFFYQRLGLHYGLLFQCRYSNWNNPSSSFSQMKWYCTSVLALLWNSGVFTKQINNTLVIRYRYTKIIVFYFLFSVFTVINSVIHVIPFTAFTATIYSFSVNDNDTYFKLWIHGPPHEHIQWSPLSSWRINKTYNNNLYPNK